MFPDSSLCAPGTGGVVRTVSRGQHLFKHRCLRILHAVQNLLTCRSTQFFYRLDDAVHLAGIKIVQIGIIIHEADEIDVLHQLDALLLGLGMGFTVQHELAADDLHHLAAGQGGKSLGGLAGGVLGGLQHRDLDELASLKGIGYGFYKVFAELNGVPFTEIPLKDTTISFVSFVMTEGEKE